MKLPLSWLGEFVQIDADLPEVCRRLTVAGLEVETIEQLKPTFAGVVVAKVIGVERHPNADRLSLCEVDAGSAGHFRVVCGAPNVHPGMGAALAKVGAKLAGGVHGEGTGNLENAVPLQAAVIRGVQSEGMLCSELELGMSPDHEGILELPGDATPGLPLEKYLNLPDVVLDIAITPNRGDCLSILGLARELAALFEIKLQAPRIRPAKVKHAAASDWKPVTVALDAPELCPRYAALAMDGIKLGASPLWMRRRLELCGMRAINNVVDVTNYVMLERGQPLHAFDASRIADHAIKVRRAATDYSFETLDGTIRTLEPNDLVIADSEKPLALAGVMGGRNSEVKEATSAIILESAYFEPMTIARTARRLGLRSEASYRFERGIDRAGQVAALMRASELLREAGAIEIAPILDIEAAPAQARTVTFDTLAMNSLLGTELAVREVKRRLQSLGCKVEGGGRGLLEVVPPSFRPDLNESADLAEEIARLKGLGEIPATPPTRPAVLTPPNPRRMLVRRIYETLIGCGLVEAKTIAFVAPADNQRFPGIVPAEPAQVVNPLSAELSEMRRSLIPGLLNALRFNLNREANAFHAFELGRVFGLKDGNPAEFERIAAVSYGDYAMGTVGEPAIAASFFSLKGILETLFRSLGDGKGIRFRSLESGEAIYLHPGRSAAISFEDESFGVLGELHPAEMLRLDLAGACVLFEIDLARVIAYGSQPRQRVIAPPRYPAVRRDVALVIDRDFPAEKVTDAISNLNVTLLESVELFDVYQGASLPAGKKSVGVACRYRGKDRTLTDEEVNRAHAALVEQATAQLGAELRY
jgi:phenylalanyl-tRNA synthetase beta chain